MPDLPKEKTPPVSESAELKHNSFGKKAKHWIISVVVIFAVSTVVEKVFDHLGKSEALRHYNDRFIAEMKLVDPFNLIRNFCGYIWHGGPPHRTRDEVVGLAPYAAPAQPEANSNIVVVVANAFAYACKMVVSSGAVGIITALASLFLGILAVYDNDDVPLRGKIVMAPLFGACFVWVLVKLMLLASWILSGLLEAPAPAAYASLTGPTVGWGVVWAIIKEREHHMTSTILKKIT